MACSFEGTGTSSRGNSTLLNSECAAELIEEYRRTDRSTGAGSSRANPHASNWNAIVEGDAIYRQKATDFVSPYDRHRLIAPQLLPRHLKGFPSSRIPSQPGQLDRLSVANHPRCVIDDESSDFPRDFLAASAIPAQSDAVLCFIHGRFKFDCDRGTLQSSPRTTSDVRIPRWAASTIFN